MEDELDPGVISAGRLASPIRVVGLLRGGVLTIRGHCWASLRRCLDHGMAFSGRYSSVVWFRAS